MICVLRYQVARQECHYQDHLQLIFHQSFTYHAWTLCIIHQRREKAFRHGVLITGGCNFCHCWLNFILFEQDSKMLIFMKTAWTYHWFMFRHKGEWMKMLIFMKTAWTYHWFMFRHKGEWMNNIIITYPAWITYKQLFIDPGLPLSWGADLQCYLLHKIFGLIL